MQKLLYVASSWRNEHYEGVIDQLTAAGFRVWDWREPPTGGNGFSWKHTGATHYENGDRIWVDEWFAMLATPAAQAGFASDLAGMTLCTEGVLLLPSGRSAHLEAGWMAGRGKRVHILAPEPTEPDLMAIALGGVFCSSTRQLIDAIKGN